MSHPARTEVKPKSATVHLVVKRADGTATDLGIVSAEYSNPIRQAWWRLVGKPLADRRIQRANEQAKAIEQARSKEQ